MTVEENQTALVRAWLKTIEDRDVAGLARYYAPDAIQVELPNRLNPGGARSDVAAMTRALERSRSVVTSQSYRIDCIVAEGAKMVLELWWEGVLAVPFGALKAGDTMTAFSAVFLEFRDGRIAAQRNYDCFPDFTVSPA